MNEKAIYLSKKKLSVLIAGGLVFVAIGFWMLFQDPDAAKQMPPGLRNATAMKSLAVISIVFFGACAATGVAKMFDQRPGLIFNSVGLQGTNLTSGTLIKWTEIRELREFKIHRQRFLALELVDTEEFLAKLSPAKVTLYRLNIKLVGTAIAISASSLQIGFADMTALCTEYWRKYR